MTLSIKLIEYVQTVMTTNDIIHLHSLVNQLYDHIKQNAKNTVDWESTNTFKPTPSNTTISAKIIDYIQTGLTLNDILQLHCIVNSIYDDIKKETKHFAALKWACLHPEQNRQNNKVQQRKLRASQKNIKQTNCV